MTYLPAKRKRERMNVRVVEKRESARHRKFVRGHECIASTSTGGIPIGKVECYGPIQFAHVRAGLPQGEQAGKGLKPHDAFAVPMCVAHHCQQHALGEQSFERTYAVNLLQTALGLSRISPCPRVKGKARSLA